MTTVAWDGRTLAADKQITFGSLALRGRKVFRVPDPDGRRYLVGFAGKAYVIEAMLFWMRNPATSPPRIHGDDDIHVLIVDGRRRLFTINNASLVWVPVSARRYAIGSGADFAEGAMDAGAPAAAAVRIAMRRDVHTGIGVDSVSFEGWR